MASYDPIYARAVIESQLYDLGMEAVHPDWPAVVERARQLVEQGTEPSRAARLAYGDNRTEGRLSPREE